MWREGHVGKGVGMKKKTALFLVTICLLFGICGCSVFERPASLGENVAISEDGVISADVLSEMKRKNQVVKFHGASGGLDYEWTIFGSDINKEKPLNLGLDITKATDSKVVFRFLSKENFGFSPTLSITLNEKWDTGGDVYTIAETKSGRIEKKIGSATLTVKDADILTFTPTTQKGTVEIRATRSDSEEGEGTKEAAVGTKGSKASGIDTGNKAGGASVENGKSGAEGLRESQNANTASGNLKSDGEKSENTESGPAHSGESEGSESLAEQPKKKHTVTFSIECTSIFSHLSDLAPDKLDVLPKNGIIFAAVEVEFFEGETVYDLLRRVCDENGILLEASFTPMYNSTYIEGIANLYEFDCGPGSGWMYCVDGWYPNYGCSQYLLKDGQNVQWRYTCELGSDIGGSGALAG